MQVTAQNPSGRSAATRPAPALVVKELYKTYRSKSGQDDYLALRGIDLSIDQGEVFTVLGPSGCGKSTLLRCLAGLETPDSGVIATPDNVLFSSDPPRFVPTNRRGFGMVFQSYAIWPHMTVRDNVAYPLTVNRRTRPPKEQVDAQVAAILEKVRLGPFADRRGNQLSGGQQQRLAVARALVMRPPVLLLDEPLSNLDARLRDDLRAELQRLQAETDVTMVYVTHDQTEALSLSSRIAVMNQGRVEQIGTPTEIYNFPATEFVATFVGHINLIAGEVGSVAGDHIRVRTPIGTVESAGHGGIRFGVGDAVTVCIRPENIGLEVVAPGSEPVGEFRGRVMSRSYLGELGECQVRCGSETVTVRSHPRLIPEPGTDVAIKLNPERSHVIAVEQGDRRR